MRRSKLPLRRRGQAAPVGGARAAAAPVRCRARPADRRGAPARRGWRGRAGRGAVPQAAQAPPWPSRPRRDGRACPRRRPPRPLRPIRRRPGPGRGGARARAGAARSRRRGAAQHPRASAAGLCLVAPRGPSGPGAVAGRCARPCRGLHSDVGRLTAWGRSAADFRGGDRLALGQWHHVRHCSRAQSDHHLAALDVAPLDLLIIGGGITGAALAYAGRTQRDWRPPPADRAGRGRGLRQRHQLVLVAAAARGAALPGAGAAAAGAGAAARAAGDRADGAPPGPAHAVPAAAGPRTPHAPWKLRAALRVYRWLEGRAAAAAPPERLAAWQVRQREPLAVAVAGPATEALSYGELAVHDARLVVELCLGAAAMGAAVVRASAASGCCAMAPGWWGRWWPTRTPAAGVRARAGWWSTPPGPPPTASPPGRRARWCCPGDRTWCCPPSGCRCATPWCSSPRAIAGPCSRRRAAVRAGRNHRGRRTRDRPRPWFPAPRSCATCSRR